MIQVELYRNNRNHIKGYNIRGHADYDIKGKDIVCAAVSALSQTTLLSLVKVCNIEEEYIEYIIDDEKGIMDVKIPDKLEMDSRIKAQTLFESLEVGIRAIIESYPRYVTLKYREV